MDKVQYTVTLEPPHHSALAVMKFPLGPAGVLESDHRQTWGVEEASSVNLIEQLTSILEPVVHVANEP